MNRKILTYILVILTMLTGCGGARSPRHDALSISSNSFISWSPPTTYTDKTPLSYSSIAGYQVYVGTSEDDLRTTTYISDSTTTSYKLNKIGTGIRYIAVSCLDTKGIESGISSILILNIY